MAEKKCLKWYNKRGYGSGDIAGKVVEREINETDHKALIDEFIRNVGDAS